MAGFDILTIGAAVRDIFLRSDAFEETPNADAPDGLNACVPLGAKISLDNIFLTSGGGATNAAVSCARLGHKTACLTRVGSDEAGLAIISELRREGIDTHTIQRDQKLKTAHSIILLAGGGHRAILTYRGASEHLDGKSHPWTLAPARWIYLTALGGNLHLLKKIFSYSQTCRNRLAWNPGRAELEHGLEALSPFLEQTDVLSLNREEAALLSKQPTKNLDAITHALARLPRRALIITDGENGAYVYTRQANFFAPALPAKRVNTTGAGDAFGSAFVAMLAHGADTRTAMQVALLNATGVISHMGAKAGILLKRPSATALKRVRVKIIK